MTGAKVDKQVDEARAIELIERVTDSTEKWAKNQMKIGITPTSIEKRIRTWELSKQLLKVQGLKVSDLLLDVVIESCCLYHDKMFLPNAEELSDPTIETDDEDDD